MSTSRSPSAPVLVPPPAQPPSGSEEDEEDEEEPRLKYQRLMVKPLKVDKARCLQVHYRFLVLGTEAGHLYVLDVSGNTSRHFKDHGDAVTDISVDVAGDYIGSSSRDGKVVVRNLFSDDAFTYKSASAVHALAIDPQYGKSRRVVFGGKSGHLTLIQKGTGLMNLFRAQEEVQLYVARDGPKGRDPVTAIAWRGSLIAWANTTCVRVYDLDSGQDLPIYERSQPTPHYKCYLVWESDDTLMFSWFDLVTVVAIRGRSSRLPVGGGVSGLAASRTVETLARFQTDFRICGMAPYGDLILLLSYVAEEDRAGTGKLVPCQPEMEFVRRSGEEVTSEILPIRRFEVNYPQDYTLASIGEGADVLFYIVSPTDLVLARPRDVDDHVTWLLRPEKPDYQAALECARAHEKSLRSHNLTEIGEAYLGHLMDTGQVRLAAQLCPEILKRDKALWEKWVFRFESIGGHDALAPYIPTRDPQLAPYIYEVALNAFLRFNPDLLLEMVKKWPSELYKVPAVIEAVEQRIAESGADERLQETLAVLYTYTKQYDKTLLIYLRLKKREAFELISRFNLFKSVEDSVQLMLRTNENEALKLLVGHTEQIPVRHVVKQLESAPLLLHRYLHELFFFKSHTIAAEFHNRQVELYAQFEPKTLLKFLQLSPSIDLDRAKAFCLERRLYPELAFILGRMGNTKEALHIIMDKLSDVEKAIEFVSGQNDAELWEVLIDHSMRNAKFISGLLQNMGASEFVNPIQLIRRIPDGQEIPGLRDHLVKILSDYNLQRSLREGCNSILKADSVGLMERLDRVQRAGTRVDQDHFCASCNGPIIGCANDTGLVIFFCGHHFHTKCLQLLQSSDSAAGSPIPANQSAASLAAAAAASSANARSRPTSRFDEPSIASSDSLNPSLGLESGEPVFYCIICNATNKH